MILSHSLIILNLGRNRKHSADYLKLLVRSIFFYLSASLSGLQKEHDRVFLMRALIISCSPALNY
jgi:hypothetical protein